ncbi:MAG: ricin-type beta-trefoil lectin domain protein, partial [Steroidobacterales bacterium]
GRPFVFSESAPAYFRGTPDWYDVLGWVRDYGQLWREGTDVQVYDPKHPDLSRFGSVMWNYDYNIQLARFQKPGNWNDADFIIGGDRGMTVAETRSQLALWSMMSAPLILSSDLDALSPAAIAILGTKAVLAVDQDPSGRMATLVRRSPSLDLLMKPLQGGDYAVAVLNRSRAGLRLRLRPRDLGFEGRSCRLDVQSLWSGAGNTGVAAIVGKVQAHDTQIWRIRPAGGCGNPVRIGIITRIVPGVPENRQNAADYTRCLAAPGRVQHCSGTAAQTWRIAPNGMLRAGRKCLTRIGEHAVLARCEATGNQRWRYTQPGNLIEEASHRCLTGFTDGRLRVRSCGHNLASQVWSLPGEPAIGAAAH